MRGGWAHEVFAAAAPLAAQISSDFLQQPMPITKMWLLAQNAPAFFGFAAQPLQVAKRKFLPPSRSFHEVLYLRS